MDLIIHIIIALTMVVTAFCLLIVVKIIGDLEAVVTKLNRRIATIEHNNTVLMATFRKNSIKVVEDEAPLDFPNDRKE